MRCLLAASPQKARAFVILSFILLLLSCTTATPTEEPAPAASPQPMATTVPTPVPTATPVVSPPPQGKTGGSLSVAGFADIPHRDVHQEVQETLASMGPGLAYSRLLRLRSSPDLEQPNVLLECDLCESWELTPDFAYEFRLRPGVRWQDIAPVNGRPLEASDLVFSYERLRTPGWPNASLLSSIGAITGPDSRTLRVELARSDSDALLALADGHSKIVAPEVVEQYGDLKDSPVIGTGPWIWKETTTGVGTTLVRNPDYFEEGLPFLDELVINVIKQSDVAQSADEERLAALMVGVVDVTPLPPEEWRALRESSQQFDSRISRKAGTGVVLSMNAQSPVLSDPKVRRAVFRAIDPWDYLDTIWAGQGFASVGIPVQRSDWLLGQEEMRNRHFANPSEARDLLAGSGQSGPVDIELTVWTESFGEAYLQLGEAIAEDLRAAGFNPSIRRLGPAQYRRSVMGESKDYQVALGVLPPTSTTNSFLFALLHSNGQWDVAAHQDSELDSMIEQQASEFDPARREAQLKELQQYILDQAYLFTPVTGASRWVFNPRLKGFHPNTALSEYIYWSRAWLEQ